MSYTLEQIQYAVRSKGYKWFNDLAEKGYDVNIVGIRNSATKDRVTNAFDDHISISYKDFDGSWKSHCYPCTTDPGTHWVENLMNPDGVAILKPGQYRGSHKIGLHQGKYEALRQKKPLKVYRDGDKDREYDLLEENVQEGIYGINIHRATARIGRKSTRVDKWSAGCQVIAASDDFAEFMEIVNQAKNIHGNSFSYTLIESADIKT
tara:strand:+ start:1838 stop:2458 length:621 start_codon:yes stop_codon:yes gene_type:complete